jgi:hypothetical protein
MGITRRCPMGRWNTGFERGEGEGDPSGKTPLFPEEGGLPGSLGGWDGNEDAAIQSPLRRRTMPRMATAGASGTGDIGPCSPSSRSTRAILPWRGVPCQTRRVEAPGSGV